MGRSRAARLVTHRMTGRAPGVISTHGLVGMTVNAVISTSWNAAPGHGSLGAPQNVLAADLGACGRADSRCLTN